MYIYMDMYLVLALCVLYNSFKIIQKKRMVEDLNNLLKLHVHVIQTRSFCLIS